MNLGLRASKSICEGLVSIMVVDNNKKTYPHLEATFGGNENLIASVMFREKIAN
jgi:hypothetical protein